MNESQLFSSALIMCLVGFFVLGFVVLFIPVSYDEESSTYMDGVVLRISPTKNEDTIITVKETLQKSLLMNKEQNISVGSTYRFYDPISISSSDLIQVSALRILQP